MSVDGALEIAIITGLSGAGRSTAAKALEDLGWYVVDNLPPSLLATLADLGSRSRGVSRIAAVVDVRSRAFTSDLRAALDDLDRRGLHPQVVFLEATDEALVRRFESVRRPHPLQGDGRLVEGIERERRLLRDLRGEADLVVDTSGANVHELRAKISAAFSGNSVEQLHATVVSFGYKYGLPADADVVLDCRFLPNPHWIEELQPYTGKDPQVREFVLGQPAATEFVERAAQLVAMTADGYRHEGKRYLTLAVGCTGGKHRSVALADEIADRLSGAGLSGAGLDVQVVHRDLGRE